MTKIVRPATFVKFGISYTRRRNNNWKYITNAETVASSVTAI